MNMYDRKEIKTQLQTFDFEGDLDETQKCLKIVTDEWKAKGYFKFYIEGEIEYEYGCSDSSITHYLHGTRLETDEELAKRIADNKKRSKAAKLSAKTRAIKITERERKQYLKLHAKYKNVPLSELTRGGEQTLKPLKEE